MEQNRETLAGRVEVEGADIRLNTTTGIQLANTVDIYLGFIRQRGTWGGEIEIAALAGLLGRPIAVYGDGYHRLYPNRINEAEQPLYEGDLLMLRYDGVHYQALAATPERRVAILADLIALPQAATVFNLSDIETSTTSSRKVGDKTKSGGAVAAAQEDDESSESDESDNKRPRQRQRQEDHFSP